MVKRSAGTGTRGLQSVVVLTGCAGIAGQVLLVREVLAGFQGNELTMGGILALWLAAEAAGAALAGRAFRNPPAAPAILYAVLIVLYALLLPVAVFFSAGIGIRLYSLVPGESVGLARMLVASAFLTVPAALVHGAQFSAACRLLSDTLNRRTPASGPESASSVGKAYVLETLGTLVGGAAVTAALVGGLHCLQAALALSALHGPAALLVLSLADLPKATSRIATFILLGFSLGALAGLSPLGESLHGISLARRFRGDEVVRHRDTPYGTVTLVRTAGEYTLFYNGKPSFTVPSGDRALIDDYIHIVASAHPRPARVLLVAGGPGGMIDSILRHPVDQVTYVELDPEVSRVAADLALPFTDRELRDPRLRIEAMDARRYLQGRGGVSDLILLGFITPDTLQANRLFTSEFFRTAALRLAPEGILAVHLPGSSSQMGPEMAALNACVLKTARRHFSEVQIVPGDGNILLASQGRLGLDPDEAWRRLESRGLAGEMFSQAMVAYRLDPERRQRVMGLLERIRIRENLDFHPSGLFYALRHWAAIFSPGLLGGFQFAERLTLPACLLAAAGCTLLAAAGCRWASRSTRKGSGNAGRSSGAGRIAAAWAIVTTGFLAMAFDLLVLFLFQCLFGTVYQMLGILVAAFMAGFLIGGLAGSAWASRDPRGSRLILLDAGVLLLAPLFAASALLIQAARPETALPLGIPWLFLFAPFCGLLCGAQFPLAAAVLSRGPAGEPSRIGGMLCACDLAGGLAGGLIVPLLLFPRFGLFGTLAIMGFLKAGSLLVLWRHFRSG